MHVVKWRSQPECRALSWVATVDNARDEIAYIREETPRPNEAVIQGLWDMALAMARRQAEADVGHRCKVEALSWEDVFETGYRLEPSAPMRDCKT